MKSNFIRENSSSAFIWPWQPLLRDFVLPNITLNRLSPSSGFPWKQFPKIIFQQTNFLYAMFSNTIRPTCTLLHLQYISINQTPSYMWITTFPLQPIKLNFPRTMQHTVNAMLNNLPMAFSPRFNITHFSTRPKKRHKSIASGSKPFSQPFEIDHQSLPWSWTFRVSLNNSVNAKRSRLFNVSESQDCIIDIAEIRIALE